MSASSIIQLSPEGEVKSGRCRHAKYWGIYLALFTIVLVFTNHLDTNEEIK